MEGHMKLKCVFTSGILSLAISLGFLICLSLTSCDQPRIISDRDKPFDLQGHRGARAKRPENTLPAFKYCMDQKMTTIELDTVVTKDRQLIVHHDTALSGKLCLDLNGNPAEAVPIRDLTVEELKQYDCGSLGNEDFPELKPVPGTRLSTLEEVFDFVEEYERENQPESRFRFNIELKFPSDHSSNDINEAAELMVSAIEKAGLVEYSIVQCFVMDMLPAVRKLNPSIRLSALFQPSYPQGAMLMAGFKANSEEIMQKAITAGADIISPYYLYVQPEFMLSARSNQLKVIPWGINDKDLMIKMMNLDVDGIITDYPKRLYTTHHEWKSDDL